MSRAWWRLEKFMRWEYKRKYGRLPSEEELKSVKEELYTFEIMNEEYGESRGHDRRDRE